MNRPSAITLNRGCVNQSPIGHHIDHHGGTGFCSALQHGLQIGREAVGCVNAGVVVFVVHQFGRGLFGRLAVDDDGCAGGAGDVARAVHDGDVRDIGVAFTLSAQRLRHLHRPFAVHRSDGGKFHMPCGFDIRANVAQ